ncbi:putative USP8 dimerization domain-containing protein [Lupinus albus]|uniref:Putative USP8 dimerization domain-containing protein n=1 Tax=Lupinus albus TaxID=3870 RepID=A0A6A4Q781_LUPAL|nr:putative USP8 dimerization domain-containing protein [Lupinus albus]
MVIDLDSSTRRIEIDNRITLRYYYRIADNLLKQARIYREEKNIVDLYIILLRYSSLVSETIPYHRDYQVSLPKDRAAHRKVRSTLSIFRSLAVLDELESLKPDFKRRCENLNESHVKASFPEACLIGFTLFMEI